MAKNTSLVELIRGATGPISRTPKRLRETPVTLHRDRKVELEALLHLRDGFRAMSGALIVRPSVSVASVRGVEDWNQLSLWRGPYRRATEVLFFAETITGRQFGLHRDAIVSFDPESGLVEPIAFELEAWAEKLLAEPDAVGVSIVHEWESTRPKLAVDQRLQPSVPPSQWEERYVEYRVVSDLELMQMYARLYRETQIAAGTGETANLEWWWPTDDDGSPG